MTRPPTAPRPLGIERDDPAACLAPLVELSGELGDDGPFAGGGTPLHDGDEAGFDGSTGFRLTRSMATGWQRACS